MPTDLYVHLRDGSDVLLTAVTETPTIVNKTVVSDPYRDLGHRGTPTNGLDIVELGTTAGLYDMVFAKTGEIPTHELNGVTTPRRYGVRPADANTSGQYTMSAPDNVTHVPPRQTDLFISYWSFVCSDGIDKFVPVADVIMWSPNPRT